MWDLTSDKLPEGVTPGSVNIVVLIFILSALHPKEWTQAIANIHTVKYTSSPPIDIIKFVNKMLVPGGTVVFRDYGRHDLTQLRFKSGRLLDKNPYIRGDKTRVYFFDLGELYNKHNPRSFVS